MDDARREQIVHAAGQRHGVDIARIVVRMLDHADRMEELVDDAQRLERLHLSTSASAARRWAIHIAGVGPWDGEE